jgi:UDP-N-acetylmuramoylalanine--D-glutamate ligase
MDIRGNKISILGAVRSGVGAAKLAKVMGARPFVSDVASGVKLEENLRMLKAEEIEYEFGGHSDRVFDCDYIIVSPGVPSGSKVIQKALSRNIPVYSELEFASWFCKGSIISITGTNGKTTSTALMGHMLDCAGIKNFVAGNIGLAFSEIVMNVGKNDFAVIETSSFQLDHINTFKPAYSVILNITPDHLDRYDGSIDKYIESKIRIISNQKRSEVFIYNFDDPYLPKTYTNESVRKYTFSLKRKVQNGAYLDGNNFYYNDGSDNELICSRDDLFLKGLHNAANSLAVLVVAKKIGIGKDVIKKAFQTFRGVEHRLEIAGEKNGISFINDSKATNVDAVWYALQSFDRRIYLILGGKDKGNDYDQILDLVRKKVAKIYAIGSSAQKIHDYFITYVDVAIMDSLQSAVLAAFSEAVKGGVVLLSPACASFDMFENYEHRGKVFKNTVESLLR